MSLCCLEEGCSARLVRVISFPPVGASFFCFTFWFWLLDLTSGLIAIYYIFSPKLTANIGLYCESLTTFFHARIKRISMNISDCSLVCGLFTWHVRLDGSRTSNLVCI